MSRVDRMRERYHPFPPLQPLHLFICSLLHLVSSRLVQWRGRGVAGPANRLKGPSPAHVCMALNLTSYKLPEKKIQQIKFIDRKQVGKLAHKV